MSVKRLQALAACAAVFLALSSPAQAYLDPGTGSYVLQVLAAALFASLFALRLFWGRVKAFFSGLFSKKDQDKQ